MLRRRCTLSPKFLSRPPPAATFSSSSKPHINPPLSRIHSSHAPMLTSRITVPAPSSPSREDIFSSALSSLFTDDIQTNHGCPGGSLTYASPALGDITLQIPAHPDVEEGRKLFAHYLWNAGLVLAEGIERASGKGPVPVHEYHGRAEGSSGGGVELWNPKWFNMQGKRVLELGAGTALPSIISALSNATSVTITDHPSSPALTTGVIQANVTRNLPKARAGTDVSVCGYVWGTETMYAADAYGKVVGKLGSYERILLADCLWMQSQHANLATSIARALGGSPDCCAIIVAGFHTGRRIVGDFFDVATGEADGGEDLGAEDKANDMPVRDGGTRRPPLTKLKIEEIFEVDVNGQRRDWQKVRLADGKEELKRWCVVAVLVSP